jgi:hydrogenase expression/formation protein HypC
VCLGIPGEVIDMVDPERHLAKVDVVGVRRTVDVGLLEEDEVGPGDWVLIHVGFAMARIDEEEARRMLASLETLGAAYAEEVEALRSSGAP